jgi:hypothetical protein
MSTNLMPSQQTFSSCRPKCACRRTLSAVGREGSFLSSDSAGSERCRDEVTAHLTLNWKPQPTELDSEVVFTCTVTKSGHSLLLAAPPSPYAIFTEPEIGVRGAVC